MSTCTVPHRVKVQTKIPHRIAPCYYPQYETRNDTNRTLRFSDIKIRYETRRDALGTIRAPRFGVQLLDARSERRRERYAHVLIYEVPGAGIAY